MTLECGGQHDLPCGEPEKCVPKSFRTAHQSVTFVELAIQWIDRDQSAQTAFVLH